MFFLELLKKKKKKEKLLIVTPSKNWKIFLKKNFKDNCAFFSNEFFLKNNIEFTKSQIFPKLSVYQNYTLTKNILASLIENSKYNKKKVF